MLRSSKRGFTFIELIVVLGTVGFLASLLVPTIQRGREKDRLLTCTNNMKQIGLGLHNHADAKKIFPGSSSCAWLNNKAPALGTPNDEEAKTGNGYSWMVAILPYMEESTLYKRLNLMADPWNTDNSDTVLKAPNTRDTINLKCHPLVWSTPVECYLCPNRKNNKNKVHPSPYPDNINCAGNVGIDTTPAMASYVALSATHFDSLARKETNTWAGGKQHPNGVMYPGSKTGFRGMSKDGTSNTAIVCETKEPTYAAWYDGTTAGVVGLKKVTGFMESEKGRYGVPVGGETAFNCGNPDGPYYYDDSKLFTLSTGKDGKTIPWTHGPSSNHPGVVPHLFADGSIHYLSTNISPAVYMHLISRSGGEPVDLEDAEPVIEKRRRSRYPKDPFFKKDTKDAPIKEAE